MVGPPALPVVDADGSRSARVTVDGPGQARGEAAHEAWLPLAAAAGCAWCCWSPSSSSPSWFAPLFKPLTENNAPAIYNQGSLLTLTLLHLRTVLIATVAATIVAVALAILVTRPFGAEFLPLSRSLVNIGQTFPPVAVLALAVPAVGFGEKPTLIALFLYGLLPIFENALTGLTTLPPPVIEAAQRRRHDRLATAARRSNCRWRCRSSSPASGCRW